MAVCDKALLLCALSHELFALSNLCLYKRNLLLLKNHRQHKKKLNLAISNQDYLAQKVDIEAKHILNVLEIVGNGACELVELFAALLN